MANSGSLRYNGHIKSCQMTGEDLNGKAEQENRTEKAEQEGENGKVQMQHMRVYF